jgi:hypothetical protein
MEKKEPPEEKPKRKSFPFEQLLWVWRDMRDKLYEPLDKK